MTVTSDLEEIRIQRESIEKKMNALSDIVFDKDSSRPVLEKQLDYFEKIVTESYPNPVFLKHLKAIRQFLLYFELKDEIHKLTVIERDKYMGLRPGANPQKKQEEKPKTTVNVPE